VLGGENHGKVMGSLNQPAAVTHRCTDLINNEKMKGKFMTDLVRYGAFENIGLSSK
jgi:hypothetical protein